MDLKYDVDRIQLAEDTVQ